MTGLDEAVVDGIVEALFCELDVWLEKVTDFGQKEDKRNPCTYRACQDSPRLGGPGAD